MYICVCIYPFPPPPPLPTPPPHPTPEEGPKKEPSVSIEFPTWLLPSVGPRTVNISFFSSLFFFFLFCMYVFFFLENCYFCY